MKYLRAQWSGQALLLVFLLPSFSPATVAQVHDYYVATTGSDGNPGTQASPWRTIQHAVDSFSLGSQGSVIHVAAGNYSDQHTFGGCAGVATNLCVHRDGTSSARLVLRCDDPATGCRLTADPAGGYAVIIEANYVDFQGFEVGPCPHCNAGLSILGGTVFGGKGVGIHLLSNYIHDIAQSGNDGNGFGTGCPSSGMIIADFKGQNIPGLQIIGNRINNGGQMSLGTACNQFHGLYVGDATVIQNNVISNVVGEGIDFGPSPCDGIITNNIVFHNGQRGILLAIYAGGNCSPAGNNTVNNNIVVNNGVNNKNLCGIEEYVNGPGTNNLYSNNLLQGNGCSDVIRLTTSSSSAVQNLRHEAPGTTFVAYNDNGFGDYHLKTGSVAVGTATANCTGGKTGCLPLVDFAGLTRPRQPSLGSFEFGAGFGDGPPAPTALTATVR